MRRSPLTEEDKGAEWSQKGPRNLCRESYWLAEASTGPTLLNESGNPSKGKAVFPKGQNGLSGPLTDFSFSLLFVYYLFIIIIIVVVVVVILCALVVYLPVCLGGCQISELQTVMSCTWVLGTEPRSVLWKNRQCS